LAPTEGELERAAGSLLGLAAGDALGAGYEFHPSGPARAEMVGGGLGGWEPGEWTDDTQMAICIAQVTQSGPPDPHPVGERFLAWYREGQKDVGNQTAVALGRSHGAEDLAGHARDYFEMNPRGAAGNGSLMRTAPVALAHLGDDESIASSAAAISELTHGDPLAGEACVLWCVAIDRAVREERLDGIRDGLDLLQQDSRDRWITWIKAAETQPPSSFNPNGFVVTALQAAHAVITQTPVPDGDSRLHLADSLYAAVEIGWDTDTVAAIASSMLGARWGASAVPGQWRDTLHGWPGYRADDLVRLAVATVMKNE
jgi:ADP-ribosylglycohydrolase